MMWTRAVAGTVMLEGLDTFFGVAAVSTETHPPPSAISGTSSAVTARTYVLTITASSASGAPRQPLPGSWRESENQTLWRDLETRMGLRARLNGTGSGPSPVHQL